MKALFLSLLLFVQTPTPGVITGRILTAEGAPAGRLRISVMPLPDSTILPGALPALSNLAETDASGNFRMEGVAPGRYYVVAGFVDFPTYYPGVRDLSAATVVNVTSGATVSGIDFGVSAVSGGLKVSGRVTGLDRLGTDARAPVTVSIYSNNPLTTTARPDGSFEFTRVPPGQYSLRVSSAIMNGGSTNVSINVSDKDVTDVQLSVYRLKQVAGIVVLDGKGPLPRLFIRLGSVAAQTPGTDESFNFSVVPAQDGSFRIPLPEGERRVESYGNLPQGYFVRSFTYGNVDLMREPLKITAADSQQIRLTLSSSNGPPVKVSGRIMGLNRNDLPRTIRVSMSASSYMGTMTTIAAADGSFEFPEVFPGNYNLDLPGLGLPFNAPPLSVANADVRGVEIVLPGKKEVRGRVIVEGSGPLPRLTMGWASRDRIATLTRIDPQPDGTFKIALYEGDYFNTNLSLPQGYTLKSLLYGPTDLARAPLQISGDNPKEFEIRVTADAKPVKVSGRVTGLSNATLTRGGSGVSMQSSSYAESLSVAVGTDGTYEFPAVLPGNYVLMLSGPDVIPNTCRSAVVANADRKDVDIAVSQSGARAENISIISAIYGGAKASADVTPIVTKWIKPGQHELYAAPKWLEVDPINGQTKELVISYLWECEEHLYTTAEPGPVSYAILAEHANPASRPPAAPGNDEVTIVEAHWGMGNQFVNVTPRVQQLLRPGESFAADDAILNVNASTGGKVLLVTYMVEGERKTLYYWRNTPVSRAQLAQDAESAIRGSSQAPAWLRDADPFAPREPGDPGPGFGRSPRKELGIAGLLKALAELKAIAPEDRSREILTITSIAQQALSDAQANNNYPYPPPSSKPIVGPLRPASRSVRLANASKALKLALEQLSAANPGANDQFLRLSIEEIQQALAGLQNAGAP